MSHQLVSDEYLLLTQKQVEFVDNVFHELVLKIPSEMPEHQKTFSSVKARVF